MLEIMKHFSVNILIPWIGKAAEFISNGFMIGGKLVIFLPVAIIAGVIYLFRREVYNATHPPR